MLLIQIFLALIMSLLTALSGGAIFGEAGRYSCFTDEVSFSPLTAQEMTVTAMQYGGAQSGCLLYCRHAKAPAGETALTFSGLSPDARCTVWIVDTPEQTVTLTGAALMRGEYTLTRPEGEKAFVIRYAVAG